MEVNYFTKEGYEKLKKELEHLTKVERKKISQQIAEAREKGDLSENAEYDAAKEAQAMLELKISQLQQKLMTAKILDEDQLSTDQVGIMNKVKLKNLANGSEVVYTIVPESEANIREGKISSKTPIAKGLLGKKKGDTVEIQVPSGVLKFEILDISL